MKMFYFLRCYCF